MLSAKNFTKVTQKYGLGKHIQSLDVERLKKTHFF